MTPTDLLPRVTLVLGGARSGKSRYAEELVERQPGACVYLATAEAGDAEMAERIRRHQARRGARWRTIEAPLELTATLSRLAVPATAVLVDCLTLWLANLLLAGADIEREIENLDATLTQIPGKAVLVASEVGWGIVPDNALARDFRDLQGLLNQRLAARADRVVLMVAGLPLFLKGHLS